MFRAQAPAALERPLDGRTFPTGQPEHLKALDAWIDKQKEPYTRTEAIRGISKDPGEKPAKKAKGK